MTCQPLQNYVGKLVRLNRNLFSKLKNRATRQGHALENYFLVTAVTVNENVRKLICYGANFCVVVDAADVVLV
ncbi:MAG: hypothetical protein LBL72_07955 [Candidatus Accumulibacter sp.]|jgi:hypothetical protein|nr:hypothetical protein [Accumulibacter sp.]